MRQTERMPSLFKAPRISCLAIRMWVLPLILLWTSGEASAEQSRGSEVDTTQVFTLERKVVTADRAESDIGSSVSAVSLISHEELARFPMSNFADLLRLVPGFTLVDFDGLGQDPQMIVRGFYGGGETDYITVMLDGRPLNNLHAGMMIWDLISPVAI